MKFPISLLLIPLFLQGLCMVVDEGYFHHRRGLDTWEKWGHPLDTLTVLGCFVFLLLSPKTQTTAYTFTGLAAGSCLFITKDEWVHAKVCSAAENWLHALLFLLHPLVFLSAGLLWWQDEIFILKSQTALVSGFLFYQLLRWNISWVKSQ